MSREACSGGGFAEKAVGLGLTVERGARSVGHDSKRGKRSFEKESPTVKIEDIEITDSFEVDGREASAIATPTRDGAVWEVMVRFADTGTATVLAAPAGTEFARIAGIACQPWFELGESGFGAGGGEADQKIADAEQYADFVSSQWSRYGYSPQRAAGTRPATTTEPGVQIAAAQPKHV